VEKKVKSIENFECKAWLLNKHYAKRMCSISYAFGLFDENNILQGVCTFGSPPSRALCVGVCGIENAHKVYELNRFIINDNEKNIASFFISRCLKLLPKGLIIVSYADTSQNHHGYIYQATNWIYTGLSVEFMDYMVKGYEHLHSASIMDMVGRSDTNGHLNKVELLKEKFGAENVYQVERPRKHRYFYLLGNKTDKKNMKNKLKYEIQPYPKGQNKN